MKRGMLLLLLSLWLPAALAGEHSSQAAALNPPPKKIEYHGEAIVNRVEPVIGLVNISHGDVPFAGWTAYTRDVRLRPRELAVGLVPGMKIRFQLTAVDPLTYVITALEPIQ